MKITQSGGSFIFGGRAAITSDSPMYIECNRCGHQDSYPDGIVPTTACPSCGVNGCLTITDAKPADWKD